MGLPSGQASVEDVRVLLDGPLGIVLGRRLLESQQVRHAAGVLDVVREERAVAFPQGETRPRFQSQDLVARLGDQLTEARSNLIVVGQVAQDREQNGQGACSLRHA